MASILTDVQAKSIPNSVVYLYVIINSDDVRAVVKEIQSCVSNTWGYSPNGITSLMQPELRSIGLGTNGVFDTRKGVYIMLTDEEDLLQLKLSTGNEIVKIASYPSNLLFVVFEKE